MDKVCKICGITLPEKDFYYSHRTEDGLMDFCKVCAKEHFSLHEICVIANVPFLDYEYQLLLKKYDNNEKEIVGRYLAKMKLCSFKAYRYCDTEYYQTVAVQRKLDCILKKDINFRPKRCRRCKRDLSDHDFYKYKNTTNKLTNECRKCIADNYDIQEFCNLMDIPFKFGKYKKLVEEKEMPRWWVYQRYLDEIGVWKDG